MRAFAVLAFPVVFFVGGASSLEFARLDAGQTTLRQNEVHSSAGTVELATLPQEATLDDLLRYAAEHNPGMRAAYEEWRAALERSPQVRALPDPDLSYAYYLQRMETRQSISLSQAFPWFGVRSLRADAAEERAKAAGERFEAERRRVFLATKTAYAEYAYAAEVVRIIERNHELVERLVSVIEGLLRAGRVGVTDLLRIQSELDRVTEALRSSEGFIEPAAAQLNQALGRSANAVLPQLPALETEPFPQDRREELLAAVRRHPALQAREHDVAASEQEVRLARRDGYPSFGLGVEWMENPGLRDEVRGMVTFSLPIRRERYAAGVREARAERERAIQQREAVSQELETRLSMAIFRLRDAERKVALYGDSLLPRARQTIESIEATYRTGQAGFLDLVESQRSLLDLELAQAQARSDQFQRLAQLEELAGEAAASRPRDVQQEQPGMLDEPGQQ